MPLEFEELQRLIFEVQEKIAEEISLANRLGNLETILTKYGFAENKVNYFPDVYRNPKVLVFGDLGIKQKDIVGIIKNMGLDPNNFEFINHDDVTNYNFKKLEYNGAYSDLMFGPVPHKANNADGYQSIISAIESNTIKYPKLTRIVDYSGSLKISKTSFSEAVKKLRVLELVS